jgi:hypothetical protein
MIPHLSSVLYICFLHLNCWNPEWRITMLKQRRVFNQTCSYQHFDNRLHRHARYSFVHFLRHVIEFCSCTSEIFTKRKCGSMWFFGDIELYIYVSKCSNLNDTLISISLNKCKKIYIFFCLEICSVILCIICKQILLSWASVANR